jgi:hypothetical protein
MKPRNEKSKLNGSQVLAKKPRFRIEKLEERIAPGRCNAHYNPQGKLVGYNRFCGR